MISDCLWADLDYNEGLSKIETKQNKQKNNHLLEHNAKKNKTKKKPQTFEEKEAALTADGWIHRQYEIDLNFLSPGGIIM